MDLWPVLSPGSYFNQAAMLSSAANFSGLSSWQEADLCMPAAGFEGPLASLLAKQGNTTIKQVMTAEKLSPTAWVK